MIQHLYEVSYEETFCFSFQDLQVERQEQKSKTKGKNYSGGVNCVDSNSECEDDEYAFTVKFKKLDRKNGS